MRLLTLICAVALMITPVWAETGMRHITMTGLGQVETVPDMAVISLGVSSQARSAGEAMAETSAKVAEIIATLRNAGIAPSDIQTSRLSVSPRYDHSSTRNTPQLVGFIATNTLSVRFIDLSQLGAQLDAVMEAGANQMNGLNFQMQDAQPAQDAARVAAVEDAMRKAALYAQAAGVELGQLISLSESGAASPQPMMMEMAMARSGGVPVAEGEVTTSASVTLVYAIAD